MSRYSPYSTFAIVWIALAIATFAAFRIWYPLFWVFELLIALNASAFVLYGLDKLLAVSHARRVPEKILWLAAFVGGPVGALAGMYVFRHKTSKTSFQFVLFLLIFVQIALVVYFREQIMNALR
jgi:uncharacterized membrane protein YsdA (DUF1294 family)